MREGFGRIKFVSGDVYTGMWKNGVIEGFGRFEW